MIHANKLVVNRFVGSIFVVTGRFRPPPNSKLQFQMRLELFAHPSEEMFANLLDFYRIAWDYEPCSFPVSYAPDGSVLEA